MFETIQCVNCKGQTFSLKMTQSDFRYIICCNECKAVYRGFSDFILKCSRLIRA